MAKIKDVKDEKGGVWSQIVAILIVTLATLTTGILFTWPNPSIPVVVQEGVSLEMASYLTVFPSIALMLFSPISGILLDRIGRKWTLILVAVPQLLSWILTMTYDSIYMLYAARIFAGIADSSVFIAVPTYIAEIATPKVRGTWGNALTLMAYIGNFLVTLVGSFYSIENTAMILSVIPLLFLIGICFLPETPYYLIMKKQDVAAMESLRWFRRKVNVEEEFKQLTSDVHRQMSESGTIKDVFFIASNRKALITAGFLRGAQQFSGISSLTMYSTFIFEQNEGLTATEASLLIIGLLVIANFVAAIVLDKLGRRRSMIISCLGSGILLTVEAIYYYLNFASEIDVSHLSLIPIIGLSLYVPFYSVGVGIMPTLMLGELFSSSVKGKSLCITNIMFGIFVAVSTKLFQLMMSSFGIYFALAFFAVCCFVSTGASFYFVPNTQGKTLEEIQQSFKAEKK